MKRIAISYLIGTCLVVGYFVGAAAIWAFFFFENDQIMERFLLPLNLPFAIADFLFPAIGEVSFVVSMLLGFLGNGILYAIPVYGVLSLLRAFGKIEKSPDGEPPLPPTFHG